MLFKWCINVSSVRTLMWANDFDAPCSSGDAAAARSVTERRMSGGVGQAVEQRRNPDRAQNGTTRAPGPDPQGRDAGRSPSDETPFPREWRQHLMFGSPNTLPHSPTDRLEVIRIDPSRSVATPTGRTVSARS